MKAKLKGKGGIKGLFLLHGEKIAIVLVGLAALYFVYSSLQLPRLKDEYQAPKLQSVVNATNTAIKESRWPEPDSDNAADVRVFKPIAKNATVPIEPKDYPVTQWLPSPIPPTQLRTDPEILTAVDVIAIGGSGLLAFRDPETEQDRIRRQELEDQERMLRESERAGEATDEFDPSGRGRRGRGEEGAEFSTGQFDPDHPTRRQIQGGVVAEGVPTLGGERIEQAYWATVLAKVPIREQLKRYQDAFEHARGGFDPARDFPRYIGYVVERSEIVNGKALPWTKVPVFDGQRKYIPNRPFGKYVSDIAVNELMKKASVEWAGTLSEPVDSRYTDYLLTLPLPPLVGRDFGADATHPDIPLAINAPPIQQEIAPLDTEQPADQPAEDDDDFNFRAADGQATGAGVYGTPPGMAARQSFQPRMMSREFAGERGGAWGGGGPSREFQGAPGGGGGSFGAPTAGRTELPRGVDYWLLRFFDFTVQPGKKYKYRVQLVLADPNYGILASSNMLDPSVLDRQTKDGQKTKNKKPPVYRLAVASESSPAVGIPIGGDVRVATAKPPSGKLPYEEPSVKLWAETFEIDPKEDMAIHVAKDKDYLRGAVVNLRDKMGYADTNKQWRDTFEDNHTLYTNVTVLDIDGGDRLVKEMTAPARVLLMDAGGELTIRDELDDGLAVRQLRTVFSEDRRRRPEDEMEGEFRGVGGRPGRQ